MRLWLDSADVNEIAQWAADDRISGFTTNPTLMRWVDVPYDGPTRLLDGELDAMTWARAAVEAAQGKPISIDGPEEVWDLGENVWRKVVEWQKGRGLLHRCNYTAVCTVKQAWNLGGINPHAIVSVFAGRIMDTGRDPQPVIDAAKATGAQVLWASVREPYNIIQAEAAGCDIITVPPHILRKYLDWHGLPLETVAARTIAQFDKDREGLWTT